MAKQCLIEKHKELERKFALLEAQQKAIASLPKDQREKAMAELEASRIKNRLFKARRYNRCSITGRAHGYIRFFGISRQVFREKAHKGELPGVTKASW